VIAGTGWIDTRLPVLAGFLLFAGITPRRLERRETAVLGLAFAALIIARLGVITLAWQGQNADLANITAVLAPVKAQDRVLVLTAPETAAGPASEPVRWRFFVDQPSFSHVAAPALIQHKAFYPQLFADAAPQPLRARPPYDKLVDDRASPPLATLLWDREKWPVTLHEFPYLANASRISTMRWCWQRCVSTTAGPSRATISTSSWARRWRRSIAYARASAATSR